MSASAFAQPAPTPEEVQQAQARWGEGKASFDAGSYESARVAFKQAYTVFPHPAFLQNLGEAELRCGRTVEAARHLSQFIRTANAGTLPQREAAKKSLKKASEKLGSLIVDANAEDAEIRVDDDAIGRSPLGSMQWFVEPGAHVISARKDGFLDGTEKVDVAIGPPKSVFVKLQRVTGNAKDDVSPVLPSVVAVPVTKLDSPPGSPIAPSESASPDAKKGGGIAPRTLVLIGGAVLTVGAFALVGFFETQVRTDIAAMDQARQNVPPVKGLTSDRWCGAPTPAAAAPCAQLVVEGRRLDRDKNLRSGFLIGGGVLGAATVATYFLWPTRSSRSATVALQLAPGQTGLAFFTVF